MTEKLPKFDATNEHEGMGNASTRIQRLEQIYDYMIRRFGDDFIVNRIVEMYDHKGLLFVHWKSDSLATKIGRAHV